MPGRLANPVWVDDARLRPRLPRAPLGPAAAGLAASSCASWSPGSCRGRWTAAARCGRSTSSRGSRTAGWRCSPRPTRRSSTASTPSTSARCCSTRGARRRAGARRPTSWRPPPAPRSAPGLVAGPCATGSPTPRPPPTRCAAPPAPALRRPRTRARPLEPRGRRRSRAGDRSGPRPLGSAVPAAPVGHACDTDLDDYRRVRDAHGGTVNDVDPGHDRRRSARLADDARGVAGGMRQIRAVVPVSVIDRELEATSLGQPDRRPLRRPAGRGGQPGGAAAPGLLLVREAHARHRSRGRGRPAGRHRRLRAHDLPRGRVPRGRRRAGAAASSCAITNVPGPQAPLYAAGARMVATYPVHPLLPGPARWPSGSPPTTGGVSTASPPTATWCPTPTCSASASREALVELLDTVTRRPAARRRAAAGKPPDAGETDRPGRRRDDRASTSPTLPIAARPRVDVAGRARASPATAARRRPDGRGRGVGVRRADGRPPTTRRAGAARRVAGAASSSGRRADAADPDGAGRRCADVVAVHADTDRPAGADPDDDLGWFATQELERCSAPEPVAGRVPSRLGPVSGTIGAWTPPPSRRLRSTSPT